MLRYCGLLLAALFGIAFTQTGLTDMDKDTILNEHNRLRGMVNPTASNMLRLSWNDELAQVAQTYAERCVFEHNPDRTSQQATFNSVGENLFAGSGEANYANAVLSWYNEVKDYNYNDNSCSVVCGHYTQVVWATSSNVGCGAFRCANLPGVGANWLILVCNYGPAGNFVGQKPYISGSSCSQCPNEQPVCEQELCSNVVSPNVTGNTGMILNPATTTGNTGVILNPPTTVIAMAMILAILQEM